jgi:hypothetical protein
MSECIHPDKRPRQSACDRPLCRAAPQLQVPLVGPPRNHRHHVGGRRSLRKPVRFRRQSALLSESVHPPRTTLLARVSVWTRIPRRGINGGGRKGVSRVRLGFRDWESNRRDCRCRRSSERLTGGAPLNCCTYFVPARGVLVGSVESIGRVFLQVIDCETLSTVQILSSAPHLQLVHTEELAASSLMRNAEAPSSTAKRPRALHPTLREFSLDRTAFVVVHRQTTTATLGRGEPASPEPPGSTLRFWAQAAVPVLYLGYCGPVMESNADAIGDS